MAIFSVFIINYLNKNEQCFCYSNRNKTIVC